MGPEQITNRHAEALAAESLLVGRLTHGSLGEGRAGQTGAFGDKKNPVPKHVVSTTPPHPPWSTSAVIAGDVPADAHRLKTEATGPIPVIASRTLVHTPIGHDLVDGYRLMLFPEAPRKATLRLAEIRTLGPGVFQTYHVIAHRRGASPPAAWRCASRATGGRGPWGTSDRSGAFCPVRPPLPARRRAVGRAAARPPVPPVRATALTPTPPNSRTAPRIRPGP